MLGKVLKKRVWWEKHWLLQPRGEISSSVLRKGALPYPIWFDDISQRKHSKLLRYYTIATKPRNTQQEIGNTQKVSQRLNAKMFFLPGGTGKMVQVLKKNRYNHFNGVDLKFFEPQVHFSFPKDLYQTSASLSSRGPNLFQGFNIKKKKLMFSTRMKQ